MFSSYWAWRLTLSVSLREGGFWWGQVELGIMRTPSPHFLSTFSVLRLLVLSTIGDEEKITFNYQSGSPFSGALIFTQ